MEERESALIFLSFIQSMSQQMCIECLLCAKDLVRYLGYSKEYNRHSSYSHRPASCVCVGGLGVGGTLSKHTKTNLIKP